MPLAALATLLCSLPLFAQAPGWSDKAEEAERDALVAALCGADEGAARRAERRAARWGAGLEPILKKAEESASPVVAGRIARVRSWWREWTKEDESRAREAFEARRPKARDAWVTRSFAAVELEGPAAQAGWAWRCFLADSASTSGVQAHRDLVFFAKDGTCLLWTGDPEQARTLLDRAALFGDSDGAISLAVQVLAAIEPGAAPAAKVEDARVEVRGRTGIWHEHRMWLGSGVPGGYTEDVEYEFDTDGLLSKVSATGSERFDVREMERLLDEADPWMVLEGWVPEEMAKRLKDAQAKKEKSPPRHGRRK
ncbi:MAG: hypothetical protein IT452_08680 [Planctomycetia bacterium]|nr:hypothetical protein [Planctomycetia bacterium]